MTVLEFVGVLWLGPQRPGQLDPPMSMVSSLTCWMPASGGSGVGQVERRATQCTFWADSAHAPPPTPSALVHPCPPSWAPQDHLASSRWEAFLPSLHPGGPEEY
jgi:hypothetical protein